MEISSEVRPYIRDSYRIALGKTFESYLKNEVKNSPTRVLSVGCHFGYEAEALLRIFPTAQYMGMDIDKEIINAARMFNDDLDKVKFQVNDARKKEAFGKKPWDIIVIRNPQVLGAYADEGKLAKDWYIIINNCINTLKNGGTIFISTSSEQEKNKVVQYMNLSEEKMRVIVNSENRFTTAVGTFKDEFIVITRKSEK